MQATSACSGFADTSQNRLILLPRQMLSQIRQINEMLDLALQERGGGELQL